MEHLERHLTLVPPYQPSDEHTQHLLIGNPQAVARVDELMRQSEPKHRVISRGHLLLLRTILSGNSAYEAANPAESDI